MARYPHGADEKLWEIFSEHCNLCMEQFGWISGAFIDLVSDIRAGEPQEEVENRVNKMGNVFDFLLETQCLTLKEHTDLCELVKDVWNSCTKEAGAAAMKSGVALD